MGTNRISTATFSPAEIVLPCGSSLRTSSRVLGWNGFAVESHRAYAEPADESSFSDHILEFASGTYVASGERAIRHGHFKPYKKVPGAINVYSEGLRPALRPSTTTDLFVCAFHPGFVSVVQKELELPASSSLKGELGFTDPAVASLVRLLEAEAREGGPTGRLYAEHLIYSLTARLLTTGKVLRTLKPTAWGLPKPQLGRVIEKMKSDLCDSHDLETLAKESGYSRNHFLRLFREAMQCTPHRYLVRLRIEKALSLMKNRSLRLIDIATECGFSSQAQFSKTFRQVLGMTPNDYRHTLS